MTPEEYVYQIVEIIADYDMAIGEEFLFHRGDAFLILVDENGKREPDDRPLIAGVLCSDVFALATADLEDVRPEDLPDLKAAVEEFPYWGPLIWACRKRKQQPMKGWLRRRYELDDDFPIEAFTSIAAEGGE